MESKFLKKFGFTLAETLITLAIIGTVVAITIPTVSQNTNNKQFKVRADKQLAILNNIMKKRYVMYDDKIDYYRDANDLKTNFFFKNFIILYNDDEISNDFDFYMWEYEEQTKIKHKVLEEYLFVWATKLGSVNDIIYYDGFSGCGAYYNSTENELNYGSPIIAKQQFTKARRDSKSTFYFNEKQDCNIENLKKALKHAGVTFYNTNYTQGEFETNIIPFLESLEKNPKPTFFMIDPYGIDVNFKTIERIMKIPKTEVFFNFMYNFTRRFTNMDSVESNLTNLFGTDKWKDYKDYKLEAKENALKELYRKQLKTCSDYVYQYRMCFPNDKRTYYYLFHATNNREGCSIMKDAFAKINFGNVEFLGPNQPRPEQLSFDMSDTKIDNLKTLIWNECKGKTMRYSDILDKYIDSTPYLERHIRQAILSLENEYLKISRVNLKSKTVKVEDVVEFYSEYCPQPKKVKSIQQKLF